MYEVRLRPDTPDITRRRIREVERSRDKLIIQRYRIVEIMGILAIIMLLICIGEERR